MDDSAKLSTRLIGLWYGEMDRLAYLDIAAVAFLLSPGMFTLSLVKMKPAAFSLSTTTLHFLSKTLKSKGSSPP